ncbi:MAG: HK97 family phage prohead protease [Muribaculaceae bacterium]|nr:HK97 family phage prohead protease [Muribaculaceae bacterium]
MKKRIERSRLVGIDEIHLREAPEGGESRTIAGRAIVFDTPSTVLVQGRDWEVREKIAREAVTKELLDASDIKMTMFHDRQLILARSNQGKGTLRYEVKPDGVYFEFEAPCTTDGDKAIELVRRRDIAGCSFSFITDYSDREKVEYDAVTVDGKQIETYTVREIETIRDFTLAADPAYKETDVALLRELHATPPAPEKPSHEKAEQQWREMRNKILNFKF